MIKEKVLTRFVLSAESARFCRQLANSTSKNSTFRVVSDRVTRQKKEILSFKNFSFTKNDMCNPPLKVYSRVKVYSEKVQFYTAEEE